MSRRRATPERATPERATRDRERAPTAAEARARYEAERAASSAQRRARLEQAFADGIPGRAVLWASWICTAVFTVVTALAAIDPDTFIGLFFGVAVALFFAGCALFMLVLVLAAGRSRTHLMGIGGLFFLAGSAPRSVQVNLLASLAVQVVVAVVGAALDPFTPLAFGTLVPVLALSLCGLWGVRYGLFADRDD